jgi:hypothetical protein
MLFCWLVVLWLILRTLTFRQMVRLRTKGCCFSHWGLCGSGKIGRRKILDDGWIRYRKREEEKSLPGTRAHEKRPSSFSIQEGQNKTDRSSGVLIIIP